MAVYTHDGPGDWRQFVLREDVKHLPVMEQRSQFLKESYEFESFKNQQAFLQSNSLNSLNNQLHQAGGAGYNKVLSATYGGTFTSISSNTTFIDVVFQEEVSIEGAGVPFIEIVNGQQGNGSLANFPYAYASGANSKTLRFTHVHPSTPGNDGGVAANILKVGVDLAAAGNIVNPTSAQVGTYNAVPFTTLGSGSGATFNVEIGNSSEIISAVLATQGSGYVPGADGIFTFADGAFNTGGGLSTVADELMDSIDINPGNCSVVTNSPIVLTTSTGTGTGAVANVTTIGTTAPNINGITIATAGSGYAVGDVLQIAAGALGVGQLVNGANLLSQTTTAGIGNVVGPFTIAISSTSATGLGGTITLTGDGANVLSAVSVSSIGTGYANGEVLTISNADLLTAGFAGATGDVDITLQASDVQDSALASIILKAEDIVGTSLGGSVSIAPSAFTGDILTLVGTTINENGSEIYSSLNRSTDQLDLSYTSNSTLTAVAT
jgi:hypothetical protein